jgi:hypothetical protein
VTGAGTTVVTWLTGNATPGREDYSGFPMAAVVRDGTPSPPLALSATRGYLLTVAGASGGGATATWAMAGVNDTVVTTTIAADGTAPPAQAPHDGWVAIAADATGDQLLRQVDASGTVPLEPLAVRPADGGPLAAAPILASGFPWEAGTAAAPDGRAIAALSVSGTQRAAAVWRP